MKETLFTIENRRIVITDESSASSYGVPVLLLENGETEATDRPLGPADELAPNVPAHFIAELYLEKRRRGFTKLRRVRRTRAAVAACERFLEAALPLVRRTPAPEYVAVPFGGVIGGPRAESPKV